VVLLSLVCLLLIKDARGADHLYSFGRLRVVVFSHTFMTVSFWILELCANTPIISLVTYRSGH
jgi:hypothetical protein